MRLALSLSVALILAACGGADLESPQGTSAVPPTEETGVDNPAAAESAETEAVGMPGNTAPTFTLTDTNGEEHALEQYRGEWVVLEWLNYDCPFVGKHYGSGNMPALQERYTNDGVVWLSVVSSAPGKQGHFPPGEMNARTAQEGGNQTAVLMDPTGETGRDYGARTTPQMVVITPEGEVIYNGAIDDRPSTDEADIEGATNYLVQALDAARAGEPVQTKHTEPYGCSVKYPNEA